VFDAEDHPDEPDADVGWPGLLSRSATRFCCLSAPARLLRGQR